MKCPQCDKDCGGVYLLANHMLITGHCMVSTEWKEPDPYKQFVAMKDIVAGQAVTMDDVKLCPEIFSMTVDDIVDDFNA